MPRKKKKKSKLKPVKSKNIKKVPLPKKVNLADQKIELKNIFTLIKVWLDRELYAVAKYHCLTYF